MEVKGLCTVECMSEVFEVTPVQRPACAAPWDKPGSMHPGWDEHPNGLMGRTWWCNTCDAVIPAVPKLQAWWEKGMKKAPVKGLRSGNRQLRQGQ